MKNFIIIVLMLLLAGAAALTRPTPASFRQHVLDEAASRNENPIAKGFDEIGAGRLADTADYRDRYLWVDVVKDGKTLYTGALGHWFSHAAIAEEAKHLKEKV